MAYQLDTKQKREDLRAYEFNTLLSKGYTRETYKSLDLFTYDPFGQFILKAWKGTAAHHSVYVTYRTAERRAQVIQNLKNSLDRKLAYKAEAKANPIQSTAANCAAAIRDELKKAFPGVRFSVTSSNFAGGNSVDVRWTDGPCTSNVESITNKYQYGHYNGMSDIYEYSNTNDGLPQAKYIQTRREQSAAINLLLPELETLINGYEGERTETILHRIFYKTSFPVSATNFKIVETEQTCGRIEEFYRIAFESKEPKMAPALAQKEIEPETNSTPAPEGEKIERIVDKPAFTIYNNLNEITEAAKGGKVISLLNLFELKNKK